MIGSNAFRGKHILLGITGSIAAYKAADLVRRLKEHGAEVRVMMSHGATQFITPLTMQTVSGHPVSLNFFDAD
ncbi:MAG TPA: bifunctional 4'-phosphopantothenoylcysteine decarboxylase/phosphopantothenoylcysteine synthetase, partial [Methylophaga sp.]|nr:bifunctional 4'-phosphopantothenoylcysteine decarboxylase/phosphopantothenoylcysteine synthetase [Methylophaga sp.]